MMEKMNPYEERYLRKSFEILKEWMPCDPSAMISEYRSEEEKQQVSGYDILEKDEYVYCVFSWKEGKAERDILFVYDSRMRIIADMAAVSCSMDAFVYDEDVYEQLSTENDWVYLEHYTLCQTMFPSLAYPACRDTQKEKVSGTALLVTNAYVTRAFRQRGIFTDMHSLMCSFVLRRVSGTAELYSVFALDPDVACYGPDSSDEPYIYSFEKDEPDRERNRKVIASLGYEPLRLEETETQENSDGTKLWFAVRKQTDTIIDF